MSVLQRWKIKDTNHRKALCKNVFFDMPSKGLQKKKQKKVPSKPFSKSLTTFYGSPDTSRICRLFGGGVFCFFLRHGGVTGEATRKCFESHHNS